MPCLTGYLLPVSLPRYSIPIVTIGAYQVNSVLVGGCRREKCECPVCACKDLHTPANAAESCANINSLTERSMGHLRTGSKEELLRVFAFNVCLQNEQ